MARLMWSYALFPPPSQDGSEPHLLLSAGLDHTYFPLAWPSWGWVMPLPHSFSQVGTEPSPFLLHWATPHPSPHSWMEACCTCPRCWIGCSSQIQPVERLGTVCLTRWMKNLSITIIDMCEFHLKHNILWELFENLRQSTVTKNSEVFCSRGIKKFFF